MSILANIPAWVTAKLVSVVVGIIFVISIYLYIGYLQDAVNRLESESASLKSAITQQKDVIDNLQADFKKAQELTQEYVNKYKELQEQAKTLEDTLYREKYGKDSIEELILKDKKGRIEKLINNATKNVFRCFEVITGSPLKPKEKLECKK